MADATGHLISKVSTQDINFSNTSIGASLNKAIDDIPLEYSDESTEPRQRSCYDLFSKPTRLQHRRSDSNAKSAADEVFSKITSDKDKARVRSISGKGSSA